MTKPEFYLAPDGSLQPLPDSGPLTLTDGALTYPGREEPAATEPPAEEPERDPNPWAHGMLLRLTDASAMGVDQGDFNMRDGDILIVDEDERRRHEARNGVFPWGGRWTGARVLCPRTGETAWAHLDGVELVGGPDPLDVSTWPQMRVGDTIAAPTEKRLAIIPRVGHANARHAPMRWRGRTEGGSFVVERVA